MIDATAHTIETQRALVENGRPSVRRDPAPPTARRPQSAPTIRRAAVWSTLAGVLAIVAVVAGFSGLMTSDQSSAAPEPGRVLAVHTVRVVPQSSYRVAREYTGTVVARQTSELGFELSGKVVAIAVEEGDRVAPGFELARLDTQRLETKRRQLVSRRAQALAKLDEMITGPRDEDIAAARARVESLNAQVKLLRLQTERQSKLLGKSATTRDAYDEFVYGLQTREAELNEARHNLEELLNGTRREQVAAQRAAVAELEDAIAAVDVDLGKSRLLAPFAGTIARRLTDSGTVVQPGEPILKLVEDDALEAWVGLPTSVAAGLSDEHVYSLTIGGTTYEAAVEGRFPEVDPATRTRTVKLQLDPSASKRVVHGEVVRLSLNDSVDATGYWLPLTALAQGSRGLWTALVAVPASESNFTVERRDVEVLHTESERVFVRGTLDDGDLVIDGGTHRIVPGQSVRASETLPL